MNGPDPISWPDMTAFVAVGGVRLAPWEIEIIEDLDTLWLQSLQPED